MRITIHKQKNILVGIVILLIIIVFFFVLNTVNAGKINLGMKIANISVSNLYLQEAQEKLEPIIQEFLEKDFFLKYEKSFWQTNLKKLGADIDIEATLNLALNKKNIWWQFKSLWGYNLNPIWLINEQELETFFQNNLSSIHQPAQNATLVYDQEKGDFITTSSTEGNVIDKNKFKKELTKSISLLQLRDIRLSLIKDRPEVLESETETAYQEIKKILENLPIKIMIENNKIDIVNKNILLSLISFEPVLDPENQNNKILGIKLKEETIKDYLISLAPLINREPINAQLTIKDNKVITFALSQEGISLETKDNIPLMINGLLNPPTDKKIGLKINKVQPKITTENINNMGITALLAKGQSNFSGSPESRIHNIKTGTAKLNGLLIKKGEEFSFNNVLGETGPEQGYLPELVIKKNKTIPEYGGGLCQVSTTLFRAAVNAGLKITQRYPHAFPVKYYNPQGFDATIYPPSPDLRFINNTPNNILVQAKINNYDLIFELYGTDDQRIVEIDGPYQYDIEEDGSMKAKLTQKVYDKKGAIIINKTFDSIYKSPDLYPIERNPLE